MLIKNVRISKKLVQIWSQLIYLVDKNMISELIFQNYYNISTRGIGIYIAI